MKQEKRRREETSRLDEIRREKIKCKKNDGMRKEKRRGEETGAEGRRGGEIRQEKIMR